MATYKVWIEVREYEGNVVLPCHAEKVGTFGTEAEAEACVKALCQKCKPKEE